MDWRALRRHRADPQGSLHTACLKYGQFLWQRGLPARALLAVDRGLLGVPAGETDGARLPYRAIAWIIAHTPADVFIGNPRFHYQHLADRVRGDRAEQKRWRSWACWWLVRLARPEFPADPRHDVREPPGEEVADGLLREGSEAELACWRVACEDAVSYRRPA